jgi:hypothetical protein
MKINNELNLLFVQKTKFIKNYLLLLQQTIFNLTISNNEENIILSNSNTHYS